MRRVDIATAGEQQPIAAAVVRIQHRKVARQMEQERDAAGPLDGQQIPLANAGEDAGAVRALVAAGDHADDRAWLGVVGHIAPHSKRAISVESAKEREETRSFAANSAIVLMKWLGLIQWPRHALIIPASKPSPISGARGYSFAQASRSA